jgi:hypothetical protein
VDDRRYGAADVAGETHFFSLERGSTGTTERAAAFTVSGTLALGRRF